MIETLEKRFLEKVSVRWDNECWPWLASKNAKGYGQIMEGGKPQHAHRVALMLAGVDVEGKHVHHRCGNRECVNPNHLEPLDDQASHSARHLKGCGKHGKTDLRRVKSGKNVGLLYCHTCNVEKGRGPNFKPQRRLSEQEIKAIREAKGLQRDIAATFGIDQSQVSRIRRGLIYA